MSNGGLKRARQASSEALPWEEVVRISRRETIGVACFVALVTTGLTLGQMPTASQAQQPAPKALPKLEVTAPPTKPKKKAAPAKAPKAASTPETAEAPPSDEGLAIGVRMAPAGGSEFPLDKVPAGISIVTGAQIDRAATPSLADVLNTYVPGATINEALGNPLAADLQFRGFSASPLNGTPQGLAIYQNGVRLNEVFGDSMNWDLIPQIAISEVTVMSNNPVYGLNALGGAVNVTMKDGFSFQGATIDTTFGSFGFKAVAAEAGKGWGNWAAYIGGEWIDETGWRDLSPAEAKRLYADIGVKGLGSEFHLSYTYAKTFLGVVGPTPVDLLDERRENVFTSPQSFDNRMHMLNLTGAVSVTDTLKVSGNAYYRSFSQFRPDGNVSEAIACNQAELPGKVCFEEDDDVLFGRFPNGVGREVKLADLPFGANTVLGGNDTISVDSFSYGGALQAVNKAHLFGRPNQFLVGGSVDLGRARVKSQSELGVLDPQSLVVSGLGIIVDQSLNPELDDDDIEV